MKKALKCVIKSITLIDFNSARYYYASSQGQLKANSDWLGSVIWTYGNEDWCNTTIRQYSRCQITRLLAKDAEFNHNEYITNLPRSFMHGSSLSVFSCFFFPYFSMGVYNYWNFKAPIIVATTNEKHRESFWLWYQRGKELQSYNCTESILRSQ